METIQFQLGDVVRTYSFSHLYEVIRIDHEKNRIICEPITFPEWKESFTFRPYEVIADHILCPNCTPKDTMLHDHAVTGPRWACPHKFVELGYQFYTKHNTCPTCLLGRPYHTDECSLMKIANNLDRMRAREGALA